MKITKSPDKEDIQLIREDTAQWGCECCPCCKDSTNQIKHLGAGSDYNPMSYYETHYSYYTYKCEVCGCEYESDPFDIIYFTNSMFSIYVVTGLLFVDFGVSLVIHWLGSEVAAWIAFWLMLFGSIASYFLSDYFADKAVFKKNEEENR